ncbi:hypothetical protein RND81_09G101800 [Saponaria officinalis]|uniref:Late embryogenesis abundant protein LEA-2 subgroup domain-containing protein n=1 Tax=Saponaria officinalis TaxID=3572 RepID=A0AAW1IKU4_SAPOF
MATLTIIFTIISFIPLILLYVRYPKDTTFTLEHASVHGFNLTSDGHLISFFDIVVKVNNPSHKIKLDYSAIRVSIFRDKQNLAEDYLGDFVQPKRNVTVLRAEPIALNVSKGPLFNLGLESSIGYIVFDVVITSFLNEWKLEVICEHVILNVTTSDYNLVGSSPSSSSSNNFKENFSSIDCGVRVYL